MQLVCAEFTYLSWVNRFKNIFFTKNYNLSTQADFTNGTDIDTGAENPHESARSSESGPNEWFLDPSKGHKNVYRSRNLHKYLGKEICACNYKMTHMGSSINQVGSWVRRGLVKWPICCIRLKLNSDKKVGTWKVIWIFPLVFIKCKQSATRVFRPFWRLLINKIKYISPRGAISFAGAKEHKSVKMDITLIEMWFQSNMNLLQSNFFGSRFFPNFKKKFFLKVGEKTRSKKIGSW